MLASDIASSNYRLQTGILKDKLSVLNQLEAQERGMQPGSAPGRRAGGSRAERNFNPGNIEDGDFARRQPGYVGGDGRFARFESEEAGAAAQTALLQSYGRRGFDTVEKIISRWSPQSDPTNPSGSTANYANYVAQRLGVDPGEKLNLASPDVAERLRVAMAEFESGNTSQAPMGSQTVQRTAISTPTPSNPQRATAQSAPAAQAAVPRKAAISPEYVRGAAGELRQQAKVYEQKRAALERFDADFGTQTRTEISPDWMATGQRPTARAINLTPEQARVRERLVADLQQTERSLRDAERELRANTGALQRGRATDKASREEAELYARYGGAADFFSRAGGSR
jgi:hypothetical protein